MLPRASCIPFHSIVHARLYISCIHACHAYCIVLGIGVSPSTGNEGRFVLRVTERVSIPSHRHSGLSMMEFRSCCVYMCIHFILSRAIRLLGHHASICVIGGTRIEDYTPWRVVKHTYVKIHCHAPLKLSDAANQKSAAFRSLARIPRTIATKYKPGHRKGFFAQGNPSMHHSSSGADLKQSLACMPIYCFPNLIC